MCVKHIIQLAAPTYAARLPVPRRMGFRPPCEGRRSPPPHPEPESLAQRRGGVFELLIGVG